MKCDKCNIDMKIGQALWPFDNPKILRIVGWLVTARLIIPCWKCPQCGKSEELTKEEYQTIKDSL